MRVFTASRASLAILGIVAVLIGTAACTKPIPGTAVGVTVERHGPAGVVPAGLERFYGQTLGWGSCVGYATTADETAAFGASDVECARLSVPLDYANPKGRTITLGLLRSRASQPDRRVGSLVINPGGPGASGMSTAAGMAKEIKATDVGKRFDLVGFDPRGIGASQPEVHCLTNQERDAERLRNDLDDTPQSVASDEANKRDYVTKCVQGTGQDVLANIGTRDVARDMDVLRSALGDAKLTYLGYSYGTRIGSTYAEEFPGNVRAMVLDGAVNPASDPVADTVGQMAGFQQAFDAFAQWCASRANCPLGQNASDAVKSFLGLVQPLIDKPAPAGGDRTLSYSDAMTAVVQALYSQQLWDLLSSGLTGLHSGNGRILMALADNYYGRDSTGKYSSMTDAFNAVHCVDDPRITDRNVLLDEATRIRQVAPIFDDGRPVGAALDICAFWPVPNTMAPHQPHVDGLPPVLVVSTTGDPATPYQAGVDLATALHGRLLTYEGTQHTAFLQGNPCVDGAGAQYLLDLTLPADGLRCSH